MRAFYSCFLLVYSSICFSLAGPRNFSIEDALQMQTVSDPQISPEGSWIALTVSSLDLKEDSRMSDLYMAPFEGGEVIRLTSSEKSDSRPRWSPDGRYLAFLSNRTDDKTQVWLLDRKGGEPFKFSDLKDGVSSFEWAPDSHCMVLVVHDPDPTEEDEKPDDSKSAGEKKEKTPPPLVITRLQFKRDGEGYLNDRRDHLYVLDLESKKTTQITTGAYDDSSPVWSPTGDWIAFVSNRTESPDSNDNSDIYVVPPAGGEPRRLTSNSGADSSPAWSQDGKSIVYVTSESPDLLWYATNHLAVIDLQGGEPRILTRSLDRNILDPRFSSDGKRIHFLLEDSGSQQLASVSISGDGLRRMTAGEGDVLAYAIGPRDRQALLISSSTHPSEIFAGEEGSEARQITDFNHELLSQVRLGKVEKVRFKNKEGVQIEAFVSKPPDFEEGRPYPTILWIHGGPVSQYSGEFNPQWQVFAGAGYVVVAPNPRGSSGYGQEFSHSIWADWGNKDYDDVMAAVDHVIELGYADPERLGVGGWSYGGILTNYVITKTDRFSAAVSGASETNYLGAYGTDHYQYEWEKELGLPWENAELYTRLSPITYVQKIVTPTLILCGEKDWNVPLNQSEQLYQSLKRLGRETKLIIYPGQGHGIRKPSYQKDRYERYLQWYGRWLLGESESQKTVPTQSVR